MRLLICVTVGGERTRFFSRDKKKKRIYMYYGTFFFNKLYLVISQEESLNTLDSKSNLDGIFFLAKKIFHANLDCFLLFTPSC